jgi:polysaccharide biosynthesis protein PslH
MAIVISIVSYPFLPAKVGGQKGIALFNKYFSRFVTLYCVSTLKNDPKAAEGYEVMNILSNSKFRYVNPLYFFKIRKIIRQKKATHLVLEHPYYGWLGVLLKWSCGQTLVVHSHNIEAERWKTFHKWWWPILWRYERYTHRRADYSFFIHDKDRNYAIQNYGLNPASCLTMTYGIEWNKVPAAALVDHAKGELRSRHHIGENENILLFNGAFDYSPNLEGLLKILDTINPYLLTKKEFAYKIILCGRDIPASISGRPYPNVIFAGFVEDIDLYFKGSDVFINPIASGGGIKTKLVEALGYNLNAVSTSHGAEGIDPNLCNGKLLICKDNDWLSFAELIPLATKIEAEIPAAYFEHFYWGYTTKRAAEFIQGQ